MIAVNYFENARNEEHIFRSILRDLRENRLDRPMGNYIPSDLDSESDFQEILKKYSRGGFAQRMGKFTILNFKRTENLALIAFQDVAILSGGGAELEYKVKEDNVSVEYHKSISTWRS